jgi:hypothetical protein
MSNNKAVPLIARVGYNRGIKVQYNSPSNENTNLNQQQQENQQNINIHINTSAEVSDAERYPEPCIVLRAVEPELLSTNDDIIKPVQSLPTFTKNPLIGVIKPKRINENIEFKIDTDFLRHVIKTILSNHNIIIDGNDVSDILGYFGSVEIVTNKEVVKSRDVKNKGLCCCADVDQDEVITFIKKIVVAGYNIVKYLPDLVDFINELGINL